MEYPRLRTIVLILLTPFLINLTMTFVNTFTVPPEIWVREPERGLLLQLQRIYTYNTVVVSSVEVLLVLYLLHRFRSPVRELYRERLGLRLIGLVIGLVLFCEALFMVEGVLVSHLYYGGELSRYWSTWVQVVRSVPLWSRYFNALAVPTIAGICEEIIYRGYGIPALEKYVRTRTAVLLQAIFFGLLHVWPVHVLFTFLIGLLFGLVYSRRRRLLGLTVAHTAVDIIGFSTFITA